MKKSSRKVKQHAIRSVMVLGLAVIAMAAASWGLYVTVFRPSEAASLTVYSNLLKEDTVGAYVNQPLTLGGAVFANKNVTAANGTVTSVKVSPPTTGFSVRVETSNGTLVGLFAAKVEPTVFGRETPGDIGPCDVPPYPSDRPGNSKPCLQLDAKGNSYPGGLLTASNIIIPTAGSYRAIVVYQGTDAIPMKGIFTFTVKAGDTFGTLVVKKGDAVVVNNKDGSTYLNIAYKFTGTAYKKNAAGKTIAGPPEVTLRVTSPSCNPTSSTVSIVKGSFTRSLTLKNTCGMYTATLFAGDQQVRNANGTFVLVTFTPPGTPTISLPVTVTPTPTTTAMPVTVTDEPAPTTTR